MLRVAFATGDGTTVDQHFGWCERFDVYDLDPTTAALVASRIPDAASNADGRVDTRLNVLRDCVILHVVAIGGAAASRVVNARIHPIKVAEGTRIDDLTVRLRAVLAGNPPPWLRKVLHQQSAGPAPRWTPR